MAYLYPPDVSVILVIRTLLFCWLLRFLHDHFWHIFCFDFGLGFGSSLLCCRRRGLLWRWRWRLSFTISLNHNYISQ